MSNKKYLMIFITPLLISSIAVIPWYLLIKYILMWKFNTEAYSISLFMLLYFPLILIFAWKAKNLNKKKQEVQLSNFFIIYGKGFALIVALQFFIVFLLLLTVL